MLSRPGIDATSNSHPSETPGAPPPNAPTQDGTQSDTAQWNVRPRGSALRNSRFGSSPLTDLEEPARLRPLAARLLEGQLARLVRANASIDRRLGRSLDALHTGQLYRHLGYVRSADYLTERLGMSLRRCQSLLRTERALRDLPSVAAALDEGSLGVSKAQVVAAIATPETQELWLARAATQTVRQLEALARADRAAEAADGTAAGAAADVDAAAGSLDESFVPISFGAPGHAVAMWHWVLDLVRRVAGRQEPAWRCAEFLAAEFLSGAPSAPSGIEPPQGPAESAFGSEEEQSPAPGEDGNGQNQCHAEGQLQADDPRQAEKGPDAGTQQQVVDSSGMEAWTAATQAVREALGSLGSAADPDAILSGRLSELPGAPLNGPSVAAPTEARGERVDPWDLDTRLRALVRLRQSLVWRQGRLLRALATFALHKELGFESLGDFSAEMLGASPRRTRYLIALDRRLDTLPQVRDAYRRGLVTWCQARLLIRIVRPGTESRWIRYARRVTVRRLEAVVISREIETALADAVIPAPLPPVEPEVSASERHTSALRSVNPPLPFGGDTDWQRLQQMGTGAASKRGEQGPARHRIVFHAPADVARLWHSAIEACRAAAGTHLRDWECLLIFIQEMRDTWENPDDPGWRQRYRILERDGWRCKVPGCTSRSHLNAHHIIFRSHQGDNDEGNLVALCVGHHQAGLHQMRIRCSGRAPEALWWELGVRPDGPPLARYFGDRVAGAAERPPVRLRPVSPLRGSRR